MRLPADLKARHGLYRDLIRDCERDRAERATRARQQRIWLLTGTESGARARYNKLLEHVWFSSSFLYAPDSVRFGVSLPPSYGDVFMGELDVAREEMGRLWHESRTSQVFGAGVLWAHAFDTVVFKVFVSENTATVELIPDPSDIGVYRPSISNWDKQEAIVQWYRVDLPTFDRMVWARYPHDEKMKASERDQFAARRDELMMAARLHAQRGNEAVMETAMPAAIERTLVLSQASPMMVGAVNNYITAAMALPVEGADTVPVAELWVRDDAIDDYRVVTNFLPTEEILWDPPNPLVPGAHPFHALSIGLETPGFIWNISPLEWLVGLQQWHEEKFAALDAREEKEIDPPFFFENMPTLDGEQAKALRSAGGNLSSSMPGAKATPFPPPPLADKFGMMERGDIMFSRMGGLPREMTGQNTPGQRSGEQVMAQAHLSAGPTLIRAMAVEDCIESVATHKLRLHRRLLADPLRKPGRGEDKESHEFLLSQIPADMTVRVWAHSQSPLYAEKIVEKATLARKTGDIDGETYLDYLDLPMTETLKSKARRLAAGKAQTQERAIEIKEAEAKAKILRAERRS